MAKMKSGGMAKCAKGGGIEVRGKTKGKICQENNMADAGKKQKTPEPTFKSDVDNIISGVKKADDKINEALMPVRKVMVKAAGKEEPGLLGEYSGLSRNLSELKKKKGIDLKDKVIPMTKEDAEVINSKEFKKASEATMDKKKGGMIKTKKYSKGGTASSRADGIATKGKTRGKIC